MSKQLYTPGPWTIRYGGMTDDDGFGIASTISGEMVCERWPCSVNTDDRPRLRADGHLIAAAPDLLASQEEGDINTPDFIDWMADRLVHVYGEKPNIDFILTARRKASKARAAVAKATVASPATQPGEK